MRLAALAAAALLAPTVADAPPRPPHVVSITVAHPTGPPDAAKGFVAGDGRIVTVAHVIGDDIVGDHGRVTGGPTDAITVDGRPATVVRLDRRNDLALLRVPGVEGEAPRLGGGDDARVLGRPAPVVRRISARVDGGPRRPALEVHAQVAAGDSGAPLLTPTGRVAGVIFARSRTRADVAYAVDAAAVGALLGTP
jgi:hypothetical protein